MRWKCTEASASEAGAEMFQVEFRTEAAQREGPYLLIQRAWLEEDEEDEESSFYVETHAEELRGHFTALEASLGRDRFVLHLPPPTDEAIEIELAISDDSFGEIRRVVGIIFQHDFANEAEQNPS